MTSLAAQKFVYWCWVQVLKSVNKPDSSSSVSETSLNENLLFLYSLQYFKHNKSFNKLFPEIPVWDSLAHGELSWGPEVVTHLRILIMEMASQSVPDVFAARWSAT